MVLYITSDLQVERMYFGRLQYREIISSCNHILVKHLSLFATIVANDSSMSDGHPERLTKLRFNKKCFKV
jgi:hypothetical protein